MAISSISAKMRGYIATIPSDLDDAARQWSSGFLPTTHQGIKFRAGGDPEQRHDGGQAGGGDGHVEPDRTAVRRGDVRRGEGDRTHARAALRRARR